MITSTISITEVIWTILCIVGLFFNARILIRVLEDLRFVRMNQLDSMREYVARMTVSTYMGWTVVQAAFVVAGVIAMTIPPADPNTPVSGFQIIISVIFILVSFILALSGYINESRRSHLIKMLREQEMETLDGSG